VNSWTGRRVQHATQRLVALLGWWCFLVCAALPPPLWAAWLEANAATAAQLQALKGVGPVLAERIVQARQQQPFRDWADLQARVSGLGPKKAEALSVQGLRVNGASWGSELARAQGKAPMATSTAPPPKRADARPAAPPASAYPFIPGLSAPAR
jgi:competence protein ComEA